MQDLDMKKTEDILIEAGLISAEKLREIKKIELNTGEKLEKILLSEGVINYKEILGISAKKMGVDFIDLENIHINKSAISIIKPKIASKYSVLPFEIRDNLLFLAMQNPDDIFLIDEIKVFTQMEIKPFLADSRLLNKAIRYFYNLENSEIEAKAQDTSNNTERNISNVDELLRTLIQKALKISCLNIHIDSVNKNLRIRYRVDGTLIEEKAKHSIGYEEFMVRIKVMAGLFTCDRNVPQKGTLSYDINEKERMNLEVLVLPVVGGEKLLIKLEKSVCYFNLSDIGMSEKEQRLVRNMLDKRSGMVIVTGLSGCGKTTTCYSMIKEIISKELNIITIEKKTTQKIEGVNQVQLDSKRDSSVEEFIESIIMHDPDVIMADIDINGSSETDISILKQLMNTALSGKFIIVTMNFPSAFETISGLISLGFEKYMVATSIEGIIAQHLVRKKCTACGSKKDSDQFLDAREKVSEHKDYKARCEVCNDVGYKGNVGIFEVFTMNKEYRKFIMRDGNFELMESKIESEYSSFKNNCIRLINDNITSIEEIIRLGIGKDVLNF